MISPLSNGLFSYNGRLVFNGLYVTKILNANFDLEHVVTNELKDFSHYYHGYSPDGYGEVFFWVGYLARRNRRLCLFYGKNFAGSSWVNETM